MCVAEGVWRGVGGAHTNTICPLQVKMSDTDFDIGALGLHEFTDDFAELVGIGELSLSSRRREGRIWARRRGHALRGIHVMQAAAESGYLLRALQSEEVHKISDGINYAPPA